jgi:hypothetical protein
MTYILGDLNTYHNEEDFKHKDIQTIYAEGLKRTMEDDELVLGVWSDNGDNLVAVIHQGEIFIKVAQ